MHVYIYVKSFYLEYSISSNIAFYSYSSLFLNFKLMSYSIKNLCL